MDIGKLNCRVAIQYRAAGQDGTGKPNGAWLVLDNVWANVRHEQGAEFVKANHDASVVQASVRIRRRLDVSSSMRVVYEGATYQIVAVLHDHTRKQWTDLVCELIHG